MIVDKQLEFSAAQTPGSSEISENVIDLSVARDVASGEQLYVVVVIDTTFYDADAAATLTITVYTDNDVAFGSPTTVIATKAFSEAELAAGRAPIIIPLPPGMKAERYMALYYTVGVGAFDTGALTASLTNLPPTNGVPAL